MRESITLASTTFEDGETVKTRDITVDDFEGDAFTFFVAVKEFALSLGFTEFTVDEFMHDPYDVRR